MSNIIADKARAYRDAALAFRRRIGGTSMQAVIDAEAALFAAIDTDTKEPADAQREERIAALEKALIAYMEPAGDTPAELRAQAHKALGIVPYPKEPTP